MGTERKEDETVARNAAQFATTHWSVVLATGDSQSPESQEALEKLCRTYWRPVYVFVRRKGCNHQQAEDLTQGFFPQLIAKKLASRSLAVVIESVFKLRTRSLPLIRILA